MTLSYFPERQKNISAMFEKFSSYYITALTLKVKLIDYSVLAVKRLQGNYTVDRLACDKQIGFVLLQKQPGGT